MRLTRLFAAAAVVGLATQMTAAAPFVPVALSEDPVPGIPGATFSGVGASVIAGNGQVAMTGAVTGSNTAGVWAGTLGSLQKVASTDTNSAPGGGRFRSIYGTHVDSLGRVAFEADLTTSTSADTGLWQGAAGSLQLTVRSASIAPGTTAQFGQDFQNFRANDAGQVAFHNILTGSGVTIGNDGGIWVGSPGAVQLVAREGEAAPAGGGVPAGRTFNILNPQIALNDNGQVAFKSNLAPSGAAVWIGSGGAAPTPAAVGGQPAPGAGGATFIDFSSVSINNAGHVALQAQLFGSGVNSSNNQGLWVGAPGALQLVVRGDDPAPETNGGRFGNSAFQFNRMAFNGLGQVAFTAGVVGDGSIPGENAIGVWVGGAGGLELAGRAGFEFPIGFDINALQMNDAGDVVILGGADPSRRTELWHYQLGEDTLQRLLAAGDSIDVDPGPDADLRTVSGMYMSFTGGNEDGSFSSLNDARRLVLDLSFTDASSGVFVTDLSAVPEPAGGAGVALAALTFMSRRRARRHGGSR